MPLLSGLLHTLPYDKLHSIKHSKSYNAQHKKPSKWSIYGYSIIKLEEDVTFHVGWRPDDMKEHHAKKGEYLVQCPLQPPSIVTSWAELRKNYRVFRNQS